jgi:hypothetical protein
MLNVANSEATMPQLNMSAPAGQNHTSQLPQLDMADAAELNALLEQKGGVVAAAGKRGLLGAKDRTLGGRFPAALIEAAKTASGISEATELLTYALAKVALEDNYGEKLLALKGSVPRGTFGEV